MLRRATLKRPTVPTSGGVLRVERRALLRTPRPMPHTIHRELSSYVHFDSRDARRVAQLGPIIAPTFREIAEEFYDRTRDFEAAHAVFEDEAQIERLKLSLVAWMKRLFSGVYDEEFFAYVSHVGHVHVRIGLPQRYMFSAMNLLRTSFGDLVRRSIDGVSYAEHLQALDKLLDLSLAVMLESYFGETLEMAQQIERTSTERLFASREHRYVAAIESSELCILGSDEAGVVRLLNACAEKCIGLARSEVVDKRTLTDLFVEEDRLSVTRVLESLLRGGEMRTTIPHAAIMHGDERALPMRWQVTRLLSVEGLQFVLVGQDTTLESRLEAQARRNERLAAVGTLAAGLAHEIRNPLNGALLHLTFLDRGLKKGNVELETMKEAAVVVRSEIERLSALTTEFLDFAKPHPLNLERVDLVGVCQRVAVLLGDDAVAHKSIVTLDLPRQPVVAHADAAKLEQVVLNLARNGLEAMAPNGGALTIRVRRKPQSAVIEVDDEGPGFDDDQPIFDAFYSTKSSGTGLGLAIVHRIVTSHGGTVEASRHQGKTTFRVTVPAGSNVEWSEP